MDHSLATWASRLRATAAQTLGERPAPPDPSTFTDEAGHTRAVDAPFIAWCAGIAPPAQFSVPAQGRSGEPLDVRLWLAVHGPPERIDTLARQWPRACGQPATLTALILPAEFGLEVATEMQLCALHALTWLARRARSTAERGTLAGIARATIADLADTVQPDNATNHPWAIHAIVLESLRPDPVRPPAALRLYAQAQQHNACVQRARPDRLSAWILWDAARAMSGDGCTLMPTG